MDSSDVSALMKMQTIINICATNSTGGNATEQFLLLRSCVRQLVQEHCTLHQQLLRSYLERGRDASTACANVSTDHQNLLLEELFDTCMSEHAVKSASGTKELSVLASSNKGRFAQTMVSSKICVAEKMNWFSQETGFNGQLYRDFVSNFTWEFAPEGRKEVLRAMEECDTELEGSAYNQVHQWESCLAPKVVEICGFNNNITKFFFPFINADIQKAALEYIENLTDDDDDEEEEELTTMRTTSPTTMNTTPRWIMMMMMIMRMIMIMITIRPTKRIWLVVEMKMMGIRMMVKPRLLMTAYSR
ncbi:uncharacterized protein [Macrobrachium rosenbergii]|uniref:uncharacterized protein isoform X2 n=1 Tax=Macrobrachium rosenbergii TaxID=79674 RepID=UPI0034D3C8B3